MRAVVLTAHGGPETVEYVTDYPDPAPGTGEVLVRIGACSGENIYPGEVEALLERRPAVHQASVVSVADAERGQIPVAFIVLRPGADADEADLKQFALANAPPVQHPRRVFFKPELPLTGTSKIDRRALAEEAPGLIGRG